MPLTCRILLTPLFGIILAFYWYLLGLPCGLILQGSGMPYGTVR